MPHIHTEPGQVDYAADVFVVHQNRVLLRMHDKYHMWLAVGGHVELDEDPTQAAVREVKEEVGLDVELVGDIPNYGGEAGEYTELMAPRYMNIHPISDTHRHISLVYFARSASDDVRPSGTDVSSEWKWFTHEELERNELGIKSSIQFYALEALRELGE